MSRTPNEPFPPDLEREYSLLKLGVEDVGEFRLILATCDDPDLRDDLIHRLKSDVKTKLTHLDLATSPDENFLGALSRHMKGQKKRTVVSVTGVEERIEISDVAGQGQAFLEDTN
ncbi:MAG: hypothetical protein QF473_37830, partial [Planctomycetota bacterium]|nr:hypothetical protein [Planctomycetota bacterium]